MIKESWSDVEIYPRRSESVSESVSQKHTSGYQNTKATDAMLKDVTTKEATPTPEEQDGYSVREYRQLERRTVTLENEFKDVNYELKEDEDLHNKLKYEHMISDEQISARNAWRQHVEEQFFESGSQRHPGEGLERVCPGQGDADEVDEDNYQGVGAQSCNPRSESDRGSVAGHDQRSGCRRKRHH